VRAFVFVCLWWHYFNPSLQDDDLEIGYLRGQVENYSRLGEASTAVGRHDDGERTLVESLRWRLDPS
jgi:hypothetical protein